MCLSQPSDNATNLRMTPKEQPFDPEGPGYDYTTARAVGMGPDGKGEDEGHWGSVAQTSKAAREKYGLPEDSYMILKGKSHETFDKAVKGEEERGFEVIKKGDRYYSVPRPTQYVPTGLDLKP